MRNNTINASITENFNKGVKKILLDHYTPDQNLYSILPRALYSWGFSEE